jgi:hypothetical protein
MVVGAQQVGERVQDDRIVVDDEERELLPADDVALVAAHRRACRFFAVDDPGAGRSAFTRARARRVAPSMSVSASRSDVI